MCQCRRGSGDMRYGRELFDASKLETPFGNRYLLTVDEGYYQRHRRTYSSLKCTFGIGIV